MISLSDIFGFVSLVPGYFSFFTLV
uniref:Uncharacterized protein n=1 Tax=Anguilla anguilla TaxID=7936 RepID=A0A0E9UL79_ANGAN